MHDCEWFTCDFSYYNRLDYFYELEFYSADDSLMALRQEKTAFAFQVTILAEFANDEEIAPHKEASHNYA